MLATGTIGVVVFVLNFPINFPWFEFDYSFNTSFNHFNFRSKEYYQFHKQPNYTVGFLHVLCFLFQIPDRIKIRSLYWTQFAPFNEYQMQFLTWKSGGQHRSVASLVLHHSGEEFYIEYCVVWRPQLSVDHKMAK